MLFPSRRCGESLCRHGWRALIRSFTFAVEEGMAKGWSLFNIPLPIKVVGFLIVGLGLGLAFPKKAFVKTLYISGTYFPKTIVTFAALFIFILLAAAVAKLILFHKDRAGKMFSLILTIYIAMGAISLV